MHIASKQGVNGFKLYDSGGRKFIPDPRNILDDAYRCKRCNEITVAAEVHAPPMGYAAVSYKTDGSSLSERIEKDMPGRKSMRCGEKKIIDNGVMQVAFTMAQSNRFRLAETYCINAKEMRCSERHISSIRLHGELAAQLGYNGAGCFPSGEKHVSGGGASSVAAPCRRLDRLSKATVDTVCIKAILQSLSR